MELLIENYRTNFLYQDSFSSSEKNGARVLIKDSNSDNPKSFLKINKV